MSTTLRDADARAVGHDWFDLLLDAARRGVSIRIVLSDFDPVVATELHGGTWRTIRQAAALRELAPPGARIDISASLHPASIGLAARVALWPKVLIIMSERVRSIAKHGEAGIARFLSRHPNFARRVARSGDRITPRRWPPPILWPVTHHQKVAVIDEAVTYIGGLDLNERRWDTWAHDRPAAETWHDVQLLVRHPQTARAVAAHLGSFTDAIEGAEPVELPDWLMRTLSARLDDRPMLMAPRVVRTEIETALLEGIAAARRQIYIETQFLRDRRIAKALAAAARRNPDLTLIVMLPGAPEDVAFNRSKRSDARFGEYLQASCIRRLRRSYRGRLFVGAPVRPVTAQGGGRSVLFGAPLIYVHAKVAIFDDDLAVVGSANLNGRSLRWDTELAIALRDPAAVRRLRHRCMQHMWAGEATDEMLDGPGSVRAWQHAARRNVDLRPEDRVGFVVPYLSRPARRFGRSLPAVPEEMV